MYVNLTAPNYAMYATSKEVANHKKTVKTLKQWVSQLWKSEFIKGLIKAGVIEAIRCLIEETIKG